MSGGSGGIGGQVVNACIGLLVAAMALYGAVAILQAIWLPLCIVVLIIIVIGAFAAIVRRRFDRW